MKHSVRFFAAFLFVLGGSARAGSAIEVVASQMQVFLNSSDSEIYIKGVVASDASMPCRLQVTHLESIPLFEVRLSTEDLRYDLPLTSAENWAVTAYPATASLVTAVGTVEVHQSIPGLGIPLAPKFMKNELKAEKNAEGQMLVTMTHKVSGFYPGDSNSQLVCRFE